VPVAVNVSGRNLVSCGLIDRVSRRAQTNGAGPEASRARGHRERRVPQQGEALDLLQGIRDLGVRIAIDDFGTGYSVLSRLQGFPVDTLKIDLSFVRSIASEHVSAPIVDAMIAMGLSLGLKIVAEGVETEVQREYLVKRHCTELSRLSDQPSDHGGRSGGTVPASGGTRRRRVGDYAPEASSDRRKRRFFAAYIAASARPVTVASDSPSRAVAAPKESCSADTSVAWIRRMAARTRER